MTDRVKILKTRTLARHWGHLEQTELSLRRTDGTWQTQLRETYDHGHAAAVLLVDPKADMVILTRQFRFPVHKVGDDPFLIEICAGLLDGDSPETCARREAEEETGFRVKTLRPVCAAYASPGSLTEKLWCFIGEIDPEDRVSEGGGLIEEGEDIEVLVLPFATAYAMIGSGAIIDAKTIMALQHLMIERLEKGETA